MPCNDTMTGIDGKPQKVTCIGDLPALSRDHLGVWRRIIIRNVPTFGETLISVDHAARRQGGGWLGIGAVCYHP